MSTLERLRQYFSSLVRGFFGGVYTYSCSSEGSGRELVCADYRDLGDVTFEVARPHLVLPLAATHRKLMGCLGVCISSNTHT